MLRTIFSLALMFSMTAVQASDDGSARIATAVKSFKPLMASGIEMHKVKKAKTVKAMLFNLAIDKGYSSSEEDFSWVGNSNEAWEGDSTNWGETDMRTAYDYLTTVDKDFLESLDDSQKEKMKVHVKKAKEDFKLLLNSGVKFGVAPMGAVQCGFTYAALAIIDPATGKIYLAAKEGSGC